MADKISIKIIWNGALSRVLGGGAGDAVCRQAQQAGSWAR